MSAHTGEQFREDARRVGTRHPLLEADSLAELTRLNTLASLRSIAATSAILASGLALGWRVWFGSAEGGSTVSLAVLTLLAVTVIAVGQHGLFVLAHEAAHYRLFAGRRLNDAVGRLLGSVGGVSMCTYRITHRLHHNHLYGRQDPDIALNGGYPRGKGYLVRKLLVDLTGWTAPKTYAYFFGAPALNVQTHEAQRPLDDTSPALRQAARRDRWGVLAFHLAAPVAALAVGGTSLLAFYLVFWVVPLATVLQALLRLRAVAEHGAPAGLDSALRAARTNLPAPGPLGWLIHRIVFPHHVNYHIEHHLYPAVPHYRLAELHRRLLAQGHLREAEVRPFPDTLQRIFAPRRVSP